jgi:hypothetical protein
MQNGAFVVACSKSNSTNFARQGVSCVENHHSLRENNQSTGDQELPRLSAGHGNTGFALSVIE